MPSLTYAEMAEALKITREESANQSRSPKALASERRAAMARTRVAVPEGKRLSARTVPRSGLRTVNRIVERMSPPDKLIKALEAHVETCKAPARRR